MHHKLNKMYHLFGSYKKIAYLCTEFDTKGHFPEQCYESILLYY